MARGWRGVGGVKCERVETMFNQGLTPIGPRPNLILFIKRKAGGAGGKGRGKKAGRDGGPRQGRGGGGDSSRKAVG
jgi:hypothetical protein